MQMKLRSEVGQHATPVVSPGSSLLSLPRAGQMRLRCDKKSLWRLSPHLVPSVYRRCRGAKGFSPSDCGIGRLRGGFRQYSIATMAARNTKPRHPFLPLHLSSASFSVPPPFAYESRLFFGGVNRSHALSDKVGRMRG